MGYTAGALSGGDYIRGTTALLLSLSPPTEVKHFFKTREVGRNVRVQKHGAKEIYSLVFVGQRNSNVMKQLVSKIVFLAVIVHSCKAEITVQTSERKTATRLFETAVRFFCF